MNFTRMATIVALAVLALPAAATAHVTIQPEELPANTFTRMDVRVPTERDDAGTVKVDVELPDGFYFASYEPLPGWTVKVTKEELAEPVEIEEGFEATEQVKRITWTGDGEAGIVPPDAFQDFGLSVLSPDAEGETLTVKAIQTYEGGEVVRWIGAPDSEEPAPQITLTAADGDGADTAHAEEEDGTSEEAATAASDDGDSNGLAIAGLVVGGLGLLTGGTALARSRRRG